MSMKTIIKYTFKEYKKNIWLILVFSVLFIISMLSLFLAPSPTYISFGGTFLRMGSIPELTTLDIAAIIGAYMLSLFIFSDAITNINLIIKAKRTLTTIPTEIFTGIYKYALKIFIVYTIAMLLIFAINIATFESPLHSIIYPVLSFIIFIAIFFVPPAVIIDEMDTFRAVQTSVKAILVKWRLVLVWIIAGLTVISFTELVLFAFIPVEIAKYLIIALNGLVIIPLLTIFQTQVYLEKYPLSPP